MFITSSMRVSGRTEMSLDYKCAASYFNIVSVQLCFFFSSRRRHTRFDCDWSSDVCSSDLRILVSTPIHLRALLESGTALPPADLIVSSTAPLTAQLAAEVEQRFNTRLLEIYGSTETGQISARRPTHTPEWRVWAGGPLSGGGGGARGAGGAHRQAAALGGGAGG